MITVSYTPQRGAKLREVLIQGEVLTLNGEVFDFSPLLEGEAIPYSALGSEFFKYGEPVERVAGEIKVTLVAESEEGPQND